MNPNEFTPGSTIRKPAFNLVLQTTGGMNRNRAEIVNSSMHSSTNGGGLFSVAVTGHKTSKSSYSGSVHTAMTTAMTQSNMSTRMMMQRKRAAEANKSVRSFDPEVEI